MIDSSPTSPSDLPGLIARRYRPVRRLGGGALGDALEVVDEALGTTRCLKLLTSSATVTLAGARAALRHEFELLRGLTHPAVVELHDFGLHAGEEDARAYLTTTLVRGMTLDGAASSLTDDALVDVLCDALRGLSYLHAAGLRHGDLKPENIMVEADAVRACGLLIDLSCAERLGVPSVHVSGTLRFLAPELLERAGGTPTRVDGRADLFAFGVLLDELTTQRAALRATTSALTARLRAREVRGRPADAREVIEALGRDPGDTSPHRPLPRANAGTRTTARARTVHGRELELAWLERITREFVAGPTARVVRVVGPRGAGRSRLLREAKWLAMERLTVVEGFATRPLAVRSLLERTVGGALPAGAVAAVDAAEAIARAGRPLALVLDDADGLAEEELALWSAFLRSLHHDVPCLVIESKRAIHETPAVVDEHVVTLGPLDEVAVHAWCDDALGPHHGADAGAIVSAVGGLPSDVELAIALVARGAPMEELASRVSRDAAEDLAEHALDHDATWVVAFVALAGEPLETTSLEELLGKPALSALLAASSLVQRVDAGWTTTRPIASSSLVAALGDERVREAHARLAASCEARAAREPAGASPAHAARACHHHACAGARDRALNLLDRFAADIASAPRVWLPAVSALSAEAPADARLAHLAAEVHLRAGEPTRALEFVKADADRTADGALLRAECELERGEPGRCHAELTMADGALDDAHHAGKRAWLDARAHLRLGQNEAALEAARIGLGRAPPEDAELVADLAEVAGIAALYVGLFDEAGAHLARAAARSARDPKKLLRAASYQAILAFRRGDALGALEGHQRAHAIAEGAGIVDQLARTALNLGTALHQGARYADALAHYERGERLARALGQRDLLLVFLCNGAKLRADVFDLDAAIAKAERLEAEAAAAGARFFAAAALTFRADVAEGRGDLRAAYELRAKARAAMAELGAHRECLEEAYELGRLACARGLVGEAREHLAELDGADVAADLSVKRDLLAAVISRAENDLARALDLAERATVAAESTRQPALVASALASQAELAEQAGLASQADRARRELLSRWGAMAAGLPEVLRERFYEEPRRRAVVAALASTATATTTPRTDGRTPPAPEPPGHEPPAAGTSPSTHRLATAERLLAAFRKVNSTLDPTDIVAFAIDEAIAITGAERGYLLLAEEDGLRVAVARNMDKSALTDDGAGLERHVSRTILDEVLSSEAPVITVDASADQRFERNQSVHALKLRSVLAVPIRSPDGVLGALYLDNRYARARFDPASIDLLTAFGDQVALALRNAAQADKLRAQAEELRRAHARLSELASGQAQEIERLEEEVRRQRSSLETRFDEAGIVGKSSSLRRVLGTLDRVIDSPLTILIGGESGTGKELIARAIHLGSRGRDKPFVAINCGALPATLLESELFGHKKGAFTGADRDRTGLVLAASGGTLFLDELGEMPLDTQVKLLRVLQEREVRAVGSERAVPVDFRLVAATNRRLEDEVARGRFREDLFYRVSVVQVTLPPLRERLSDLPELAAFFATRAARELDRPALRLSGAALRKLASYDWPGNVRQLQNVITRAVVLAEGALVEPEDLELPLAGSVPAVPREKRAYRTKPLEREREELTQALERVGWNVVRAAEALGLPRATFYRRMRLYGLTRERPPSEERG